jgi:golgi-specific brefeldin A-resistance guanine nucleotide exchange factor 1
MPAEQTGLVRENYLWKMLLRRGLTKDGVFHHVFGFSYDKEIYSIIWGPTVSSLAMSSDYWLKVIINFFLLS